MAPRLTPAAYAWEDRVIEAGFTPGPWRVEADPCHFDTMSTVVGGATKPVEHTPTYLWQQMQVEVGGWAAVQEQEANARLIAAAPDLYEALRHAVGNLRAAQINPDAFGDEESAEYREAKAAWDADIARCEAALLKVSPQADALEGK